MNWRFGLIESGVVYDFSAVSRRRFVTLDAMRGIAAISVMLFHSFIGTGYHIFEHGYYAVDLFFCLSGVVLTHSYATKIHSHMTFAQYLKLRLIRLYPMYLFGSLLGAIVLPFYIVSSPGMGFSWRDYFASVCFAVMLLPSHTAGTVPFVRGTMGGILFPLNIPAWSLFFEILASISLFPVVRKRIKLGYIIGTSFALLVGALLYYGKSNIGWTFNTLAGGFPRTAFAFFSGVLIYRLFAARRRLGAAASPTTILAITAIMFALPVSQLSVRLLSLAIGLGTWFVMIPSLVVAGLSVDSIAEQVPVFAWLGRISYGVYAIHLPVFLGLHYALAQSAWTRAINDDPVLLACLSGSVVLAMAHALTSRVDEPVRRALNNLAFLAPAARQEAATGNTR
jgi:peptidoglycan/LPS O-acetylase OafA/YrhL